jgi:cytochrome c-type biogenesis protein CcmH/NrfF
MAKKRNKTGTVPQPKSNSGGRQPSYWMILAVLFFFLSMGLAAKMIFSPASVSDIAPTNYQNISSGNSALESQVRLVAANFRCACGGCGELFLIDCTCDMPRGAVEEKRFIREKLQQGLPVDQVVNMVEKEYGHKII